MENRRINLRPVFEECGFTLKNPLEKADEYEIKNALYSHIYFYWKQGKNAINIAIDPRVPYLDLLVMNGVALQKNLPNGLRGGSGMKNFPSNYPGIILKKPQKAGRMFLIHESALPRFLNHLTSGLKPNPLSVSKNNPDSNPDLKDRTENIESLENTSSDTLVALQLVTKAIEDEYANKPGQDVDAIVKRRLGQCEFRSLLEKIYGSSCHVSRLLNRSLLIASHIVPWSKSSPEEKTDPENGLLLAINWDAVFDKGFICFDSQGKVIFSDALDTVTADLLGIDENVRLRKELLTPRRVAYLQRHRTEIFKR